MADLPWIAEAKKHVGQQEVRDEKALMAYFAAGDRSFRADLTEESRMEVTSCWTLTYVFLDKKKLREPAT